jgi:uncharacterized membrane protein YoaK (UPF0700 family)
MAPPETAPETAFGASATPSATPGAERRAAAGGVALAVVLVGAAGYVDAVAFLGFGGVFTSFMSGDSTRLAAAWAGGEARAAVLYASAVALFVLGAAAGRVVRTGASPFRRAAVLALTGLLLLGAAGAGRVGLPAAALSLSALAMGAQNAAIHHAGPTPVTVTYVTGALVRVGEGLGDLLLGRRPHGLGVHAALWAGLVAGAVAGARGFLRAGLETLLAPALLIGFLAALLAALAALGRPSPRSAA